VKPRLLVLSIASLLAGSGLGADALAQPSRPVDPHIRTLPYDADQVYRLTGFMGFQTMLEFSGDERIENVSIGDAMGWQVTPNKRANLLFLKPIDRAPITNMTVVTDRRRYVLELEVAATGTPATDAAYVVRFRYPDIASAPPTVQAPSVPPVARNTAYSARGATALKPSHIFDDGVSTYFAWPQQAELPAIFIVDPDGVEGLANAVVKGGYLVIDQLAPRFVLRSDKASAIVVNGGWNPRATARTAPMEKAG
jgi:type IV secretion system protein VirB9